MSCVVVLAFKQLFHKYMEKYKFELCESKISIFPYILWNEEGLQEFVENTYLSNTKAKNLYFWI